MYIATLFLHASKLTHAVNDHNKKRK